MRASQLQSLGEFDIICYTDRKLSSRTNLSTVKALWGSPAGEGAECLVWTDLLLLTLTTVLLFFFPVVPS